MSVIKWEIISDPCTNLKLLLVAIFTPWHESRGLDSARIYDNFPTGKNLMQLSLRYKFVTNQFIPSFIFNKCNFLRLSPRIPALVVDCNRFI